jgi:hypothetical protein
MGRTKDNKTMKTLVLSMLFSAGVCFTSFGQAPQQTVSYPYWTISKDIQRMVFRNSVYVPARITTGDLLKVSGKGVHAISVKSDDNATKPQPVKTNGTPSWVVSKGVARWQYERGN